MKRITLITLILGTALAIAPAAGAVVMSDGSGGNSTAVTAPSTTVTDGWMSAVKSAVPATQAVNPATQAVLLRSEGLASYYDLNPATQAVLLRSEGLASYYDVNPASQAVILRSTGLADYYGSGDGGVSTPAATTSGGDSFAWNAAIGGAALIGAMLLVLAFAVASRRRHQLSF
jgi:hypothetical protein